MQRRRLGGRAHRHPHNHGGDPVVIRDDGTVTDRGRDHASSGRDGTTAAPPETETTVQPDGGAETDLPTNPEEWASDLIREWGVGDRARASRLAVPVVVRFLFTMADPGGSDWELVGCDGAAGTVRCTFASAAHDETVVTSQSAPNGVLQPIHLVEQPPG